MSHQIFKIIPLAAAVSVAMLSTATIAEEKTEEKTTEQIISEVVANPTDIMTDGWTVNGYVRTGWRTSENGVSTDNEFGKPDYRTAGTTAKSANQVELTITKNTQFQNGVWSDLVVRSEYGNGESHMRSSSGSEDNDSDGPFEVKEAFMKLGGMSYLPEEAHIWAGRRFLNRSAGLITGEFWKQSSGVGFGYEQGRSGVALVSADGSDLVDPTDPDLTHHDTVHSLDFYSYGYEGLGGSFDFDLKVQQRGNQDTYEKANGDNAATGGFGGSITYNRDWYGFDGWSQTAIAYGSGTAANRGVNFGSWSAGTATNEDGETWFATSYGVVNINDKWQMGSELTYLWGDQIWGLAEDNSIQRFIVAARPTYRVNDNFRWEFTGAYSFQKMDDGSVWGVDDKFNSYSAEIAAVFTVNADYFGRPQIKPFVTYLHTDETNGWGTEFSGDKGVWQFGVEGEIWF